MVKSIVMDIGSSTKTIAGNYTLLATILNSKTSVAIVIAIGIIVLFFIFKKPLSERIKEIKNLNYEGKGKKINATFEDLKGKESPIKTEAPPKEVDTKEESKEKWEDPQTLDDWRINMIISFWGREFEKAEIAYKKIQSLEENPKQKKIDTISYLQNSYCYGGNLADFEKLQEMKLDAEIAGDVCQAIGWCHEHGENFSDAADEFIRASNEFKTPEEKINAKIYASKNILKTKSLEEASALLSDELKSINNNILESKIYAGIAELYDLKNDQEMKIIILEKALKLNPSDKDLLFKAGYASSELASNFYDLSLLHYKNSIKFGSQSESVLNNLGVQYERLGMPIKAINSYKKSVEKGGTLAASNIAYKYLNAGFKDDAKKNY